MSQASAADLPPAIPQGVSNKKTGWATFREKLRPIYPFIVMAGIWEFASSQVKGSLGALFPSLAELAVRAWELITQPLFQALAENSGMGFGDQLYYLAKSPLLLHTLATAWRLPLSFLIAAVVGIIIGVMMGRFAFWESFFVPLISVLLPIPAIAWTPIVVIWSGFGSHTIIIITSFASFLPIAMAVWTGVKTVNPVWIRAAQSMNASRMTIFRTVVLPGSLPMIMSGMRIGLARAWRAGVAAEAFSGVRWGLSAGIFDAQEYLDIAFMMVAIAVLGLFGFVLEKILFQPIENRTVIRWGMMEEMGGQGKKI